MIKKSWKNKLNKNIKIILIRLIIKPNRDILLENLSNILLQYCQHFFNNSGSKSVKWFLIYLVPQFIRGKYLAEKDE